MSIITSQKLYLNEELGFVVSENGDIHFEDLMGYLKFLDESDATSRIIADMKLFIKLHEANKEK